jgi:hypothetical protein
VSVVSLVCSKCSSVCNRPSRFIAARSSFVCDHCYAIVGLEKSGGTKLSKADDTDSARSDVRLHPGQRPASTRRAKVVRSPHRSRGRS